MSASQHGTAIYFSLGGFYSLSMDYITAKFCMTCTAQSKNTKCPIDAHCQRHRRKDLRITKDCDELIDKQLSTFQVDHMQENINLGF